MIKKNNDRNIYVFLKFSMKNSHEKKIQKNKININKC